MNNAQTERMRRNARLARERQRETDMLLSTYENRLNRLLDEQTDRNAFAHRYLDDTDNWA